MYNFKIAHVTSDKIHFQMYYKSYLMVSPKSINTKPRYDIFAYKHPMTSVFLFVNSPLKCAHFTVNEDMLISKCVEAFLCRFGINFPSICLFWHLFDLMIHVLFFGQIWQLCSIRNFISTCLCFTLENSR